MSEISVTPVSGRADLREFIMLPFRLYKGVDQWVPPLDQRAQAPSRP